MPRRRSKPGLIAFGPIAFVCVAALAGSARANPANALASKPATIVGGQPSPTCGWPSVVALQAGGLCTGTLVHPRLVVYAAHCGTFHTEVYFGERIDAPARAVPVSTCARNSPLFAVSSDDYAYCLLAEPVTDIAITPMLFGCEAALIEVGTPVTIVGFGDTTTSDPQMVGIKHEASTQITSVLSLIGIGGMGVGADAGDSGGPAFVQRSDGSWALLGIVSGGGGDGKVVQYVPAPGTIAWIEDHSGVDISPCHDADGSWRPTPACADFYMQTSPDADWSTGCASARSGPSSACGPAWTELDDDVPPTVAFVSPVDGQQLPGPPVQLSVEAEADDGDGVGVSAVRLIIDGDDWPVIDEVPPYRFEDVVIEAAGAHVLELEAVDAFGNVGHASASLEVGTGTDDTGETDTGAETSTGSATTDTGTPTDEAGDPPGCSCSSDDGEGSTAWSWVLLGLTCVRARRSPRPR